MKKIIIAAVSLSVASTAALPADMASRKTSGYAPPSASAPFFLDVAVGGAFNYAGSVNFINPNGTAFTTNVTSGREIILSRQSKQSNGLGVYSGLGYFVTQDLYIKAAYRHFGGQKFSGYAAFPGAAPAGDYQQVVNGYGNAALGGLGYKMKLSTNLYIDAAVEAGSVTLKANGTQGVNLGSTNGFLSSSKTNFAIGGSLGLGYKLSTDFDLIVNGTYHYLGKQSTGGPTRPGVSQQVVEQLYSNKVSAVSATAGLRYNFGL